MINKNSSTQPLSHSAAQSLSHSFTRSLVHSVAQPLSRSTTQPRSKSAALAWLLHELEVVNGYRVAHLVICTSRFGLPQTRRRWYLVGIRPELQAAEFAWLSEIDPIQLRSLLGPRPPHASAARRPDPDSGLAARNVAREVARLAEPGVDVDTLHRILDWDASSSWCGHSKTLCQCLTRLRRQGLWHIGWGMRLTAHMSMRLQGLGSSCTSWSFSDPDLRGLAGKSMSLCVIEPLLRQALLSCGWSPDALPDRWSTGVAQADLIRDAWPGRVDASLIKELPDFVAQRLCEPSSANVNLQPADRQLGHLERLALDESLPVATAKRAPIADESPPASVGPSAFLRAAVSRCMLISVPPLTVRLHV